MTFTGTNQHYWSVWTNNAATSTTTSINDLIWSQWSNNITATSSSLTTGTSTSILWAAWNQKVATLQNYYRAPQPETQEQIAARAQRDADWKRQQAADRAAREVVEKRAEAMLMSVLTPEQRAELLRDGHFHCRSKVGNRYRIKRGTHGNVKRVNEHGKEIESLCVQPSGIPVADCMVAQKLHIEFNEDEFRKTANITRLAN